MASAPPPRNDKQNTATETSPGRGSGDVSTCFTFTKYDRKITQIAQESYQGTGEADLPAVVLSNVLNCNLCSFSSKHTPDLIEVCRGSGFCKLIVSIVHYTACVFAYNWYIKYPGRSKLDQAAVKTPMCTPKHTSTTRNPNFSSALTLHNCRNRL